MISFILALVDSLPFSAVVVCVMMTFIYCEFLHRHFMENSKVLKTARELKKRETELLTKVGELEKNVADLKAHQQEMMAEMWELSNENDDLANQVNKWTDMAQLLTEETCRLTATIAMQKDVLMTNRNREAKVYDAFTMPRIPYAAQQGTIHKFPCSVTHQPIIAVLRESVIDIMTIDVNTGFCHATCFDCVAQCQREVREMGYTQQFATGEMWVAEENFPVLFINGEVLGHRLCPQLHTYVLVVRDAISQIIEICTYDALWGLRRTLCLDCIVSGQQMAMAMNVVGQFGIGDVWRNYCDVPAPIPENPTPQAPAPPAAPEVAPEVAPVDEQESGEDEGLIADEDTYELEMEHWILEYGRAAIWGMFDGNQDVQEESVSDEPEVIEELNQLLDLELEEYNREKSEEEETRKTTPSESTVRVLFEGDLVMNPNYFALTDPKEEVEEELQAEEREPENEVELELEDDGEPADWEVTSGVDGIIAIEELEPNNEYEII